MGEHLHCPWVLSRMEICLPMLELLEHSWNSGLNESKFINVIHGRVSTRVTHIRSNTKLHARGKRWGRHHPSGTGKIQCVLGVLAESL